MPTTYPSLSIGAKRRLEIFRREAALPKWTRAMTWRDVRFAKLDRAHGLSQGFNGEGISREAIWYSDGAAFTRETATKDGYYGDPEFSERIFRGVVVALPHGRFIAGYRDEDCGSHVYYGEIHDSEKDAARMADEHARSIAEQESEYQYRWREADALDGKIEDAKDDISRAFALRHHAKHGERERARIEPLLAKVRKLRDERAEYSDIES